MSVTLSIDGPHFTGNGEIKFSEIKSKFGGGNNFGSYKRNTEIRETDPIVPDATENSTISTQNDLKFSQFRGSVKSYTATQSGIDENTSIATWPGFRMGNYYPEGQGGENGPELSGILWNGNLDKNIKKTVNITGTCGSRTITQPAAQLDPGSAIYNLTINVLNGAKILGAGGSGGIANGGNGGNGGIGLRVYNSGFVNLVVVSIKDGALVAGGGGGGGAGTKGGTGGKGANGTIAGGSSSQYQELSAGSRCSNQTYFGVKGEAYYFSTYCSQQGYSGYYYNYKYPNDCGPGHTDFNGTCTRTVTTQNPDTPSTGGDGGEGGNGGNGGVGQGYNQNNTPGITGSPGVEGSPGGGGTAAKGADGGKGGDGGDGGTYGKKGGDGNPGVSKSGELASGTATPTVTYGLTGFNRYYSDSLGVHFYTSNPGEEFISENQYYVEDNNYFYVALEEGKIPGTVALHRFFTQSGTGDHLFSLNRYEVSDGWNYEGVVGYVWPPNAQGANSNPIYRKFNGLDHFMTTERNEGSSYALEGDPLFYAVTNQQYTDYVIVDGTATTGGSGTAAGTNVGKGGIAGKAITGNRYILNPSTPPQGTVLG